MSFRDAIKAARTSREFVALIAQAVEPYANPRHAESIAKLAFERAREDFDATSAEEVTLFVRGPLARSVADVLGDEVVGPICNEVERAALRLTSTPAPDESGVVARPRPPDTSTFPAGPRPLVLLVSRDEDLRDRIDPWLSEAGYAVAWCDEPQAAVAQAATVEPHAVLFDDETPDLYRHHVVGRMRQHLGEDTPAVVAIGFNEDEAGDADGYLMRPLVRTRVVRLLNSLTEESRELPRRDDRPTAVDEGGRLRFLLDEALSQVVAGSVRDAVLDEAVQRAELHRVPDDVEPFAKFLLGPLHEVLSEALGKDVADAVAADLEPILSQARESSGVQPAGPTPPPDSQTRPAPGSGPRVLLVDDDRRVRSAISRGLIELGYAVTSVPDAQSAMSCCRSELPDALIVDLRMPGMSGRQLCALLAMQYGEAAPPVLVVTGDVNATEVEGAAGVLIKPVRAARIAEELERLAVTAAV